MAVKPAEGHIDWTDGAPAKVQDPGAAQKASGWLALQAPPFNMFNWILYVIDKWQKYFEEVTDSIAGFSSVYSAFVGGPAGISTHPATPAGFQAAIDASGVGDRIMVMESINWDFTGAAATVQITRDQMEVEFHPNANLTKTGGAAGKTCLEVVADRVRIRRGRFVAWSDAGDVAVSVQAGADFCRIIEPNFLNCDTQVDDLNGNTEILSPIEE